MASGHALGQVPPGYGERHVRKGWFGTGEARLASFVSKDRRYKPVVKSDGGQRESDGAIVLTQRCSYGGVISPLLANIYLNAFDRAWAEHGTGELVRYADDYVVLCKSQDEAEQAQRFATELMGGLGLTLHPDKTRVVDLRKGRTGFDFLGCHFHARMSGKLWEQRHVVRYYLHRWPSLRSMKRARARVKALTGRSQVGMELQEVIERLNLFLRGWGNYFRTGNAAIRFVSLDRYVWWRLVRLMVKKRGRNLHAGQADRWTSAWFHDQGLYKLMGTIRYPKAA